YKSVLKALLLESYTWTYPSTELLAAEMRILLATNNELYYQLDHYYIMLERITRYLIAIHDEERIELARRCFYLKTGEKLTQKRKNNWRRRMLTELVKSWGWSEAYLGQLDNPSFLYIDQVRKEYDLLFNTIMKSYRNLNSFGRRNHLNSTV